MSYIARPRAEDELFHGLWLCVCNECGTHFAEPRPSAAALASYYAQAYRADGRNAADGQGFPCDHPWYLSRGVAVARLVADAVSGAPSSGPMRVLEIGAGYGHNLFALRRALNRPLDVTAIEPDRACHPTLKQVVDRIVADQVTSLPAAADDRERFDVVLLLHVLEHMSDPAALLATIRASLRPAGLLALEVPHCPVTRVRWYNPSTPHVPHLFFFTERGLHALLRRCGFVVDVLSTYGPAFDEQGSYDASFVQSPLPVQEAVARGEFPPPPFPIFGEAGANRLFLRALVRVPAAAR
jgi:SAM-dependent methyltransferase